MDVDRPTPGTYTDDSSGHLINVDAGPACMDLRDALTLATQLVAILIAVTTLSAGLVVCSALFVWCCFNYPAAAQTILPLLGTGIGTLIVVFGRRALAGLTKTYSTKFVKKIGLTSGSEHGESEETQK